MALGSDRNGSQVFSWSKAQAAREADNLTAICDATVQKMWGPKRLTTLQASTACNRSGSALFQRLLHKKTVNDKLHIIILIRRSYSTRRSPLNV
jgi:hypothetical protein